MTDYKPGTVAKATVRGKANVLVVKSVYDYWFSPEGRVGGLCTHSEQVLTDVRPLVVLDLNGLTFSTESVLSMLRAAYTGRSVQAGVMQILVEQIEAQTKPPRIPEPGLWAVVKASTTNGIGLRNWARLEHGWVSSDGVHHVAWKHLVDPTLIREGMES